MTGKGCKEKKPVLFRHFAISISIIFFIAFCSCNLNTKPVSLKTTDTTRIIPPKITSIQNLPDSQKPHVFFLSQMPPAQVIKVAAGFQQHSQGLLNEKKSPEGEPALPVQTDAQGKGFFTTYSTDNGLALDQVNCSYMDRDGNLWFGTNGGGVSEYDGKDFTNYTTAQGLANNAVWCITEDHNHNMWFGTDGNGVTKYDGERFTNYNVSNGLPDNVVLSVAEDSSHQLWFGTLRGGVSKYDGKKFTNFSTADGLANNTVKSILQDHKGNIWMGTLGGGASRYDGKTFTNFSTGQGLANNEVWCISEDTSGAMWFGNGEGGITKYDGSTFTNYSLGSKEPGNAVVSIIYDQQSNMWIGTMKEGMVKFHNNIFTHYTTVQGLANNTVKSMLEDKKGNIWISTYGSGLSKYSGDIFNNFTLAQGLTNNTIFSIAQDKTGVLWLGTANSGVNTYDGKQFNDITTAQGLPANSINCVKTDHLGNIWIGTYGGGVTKFDGKSFTNYTTKQGLANDVVFSIEEDHNGVLWFATSGGGVSKFDGKSFTNYTTKQGLANNIIFSIAEDKADNLWFGSLGGGVSKFDGNEFTNYTKEQGLPDDVVWTVFPDKDDNIWFGTQQGLAMLLPEKVQRDSEENATTKQLFKTYTTREGLPDNFVTQVIQGNNDNLFIGTNLGICELLPSENKMEWHIGQIYNTHAGYPVRDVNAGQNAMFKDKDGIIWVGTGSDKTGLVKFNPGAFVHQTEIPPLLVIKSVRVNNETVCWSDLDPTRINQKNDSSNTSPLITDEINTYGRQLTQQERDSLQSKFRNISFSGITKWNAIPLKLQIPYYFNEVGFDFNCIETGKNALVKYRYMLSGYDKDWSPPGYKTSVDFGNIHEGNYTFMVKAQSADGIWSNTVSYTFEVLTPWWRSWWMYIIYAICITCFIVLLVRWNNRRIILKNNILQHKITIATKQLSQENKKVNEQKKKIEETLNELKSAQAQLIQSEKMASLGELTAGIAHEIQNPLNFVNNFSEVSNEMIDEMKEEMDKGDIEEAKFIADDIKQNLEKINHHGKRADAIVKGMLQHSRQTKGVKEPTKINALCDEYLRLSYHGLRAKDKEFNADFKTDFDDSIGKINIIPQDIGRVLLNLYNNAFYAVNEKQKNLLGLKDLTGLEKYKPLVSVQTKKLNDKVEITVTDNGNGIPSSIKEKIFQPFFTTKPSGQGTGLGLSLSYDIIKAHGGEIKVESKAGEGSRFIINLPV